MEIPTMDEKYYFKPSTPVNELPDEDKLVINTNPNPEERYVIAAGAYRLLRNAIIKHLLTFYDRIDYSDAGHINTYLSMIGYRGDQLSPLSFMLRNGTAISKQTSSRK